ncbi:hypothetical protein EMCRGX_G001183 [Ephydatia muelleri]
MPSRNRKKRCKQRAEYLQKREDILSQENKAKARERYKADPEKKKASVRDTYNANAVSKRAAKRQRYQADVEENRAAKRQRYQEGVEENRAAKRQRYQEGVEENRAAKRQRYQVGVEENRAAKRWIYRGNSATIKAARRSRYWKGRRTTTTTQSYSLFEPNSRTLAEYGVRLEKAILRDSELLSEVNNAFCNSHPLLAQKVVTRSARAAMAEEVGKEFFDDSEGEEVEEAHTSSFITTSAPASASLTTSSSAALPALALPPAAALPLPALAPPPAAALPPPTLAPPPAAALPPPMLAPPPAAAQPLPALAPPLPPPALASPPWPAAALPPPPPPPRASPTTTSSAPPTANHTDVILRAPAFHPYGSQQYPSRAAPKLVMVEHQHLQALHKEFCQQLVGTRYLAELEAIRHKRDKAAQQNEAQDLLKANQYL